jgi:hypothetical protein
VRASIACVLTTRSNRVLAIGLITGVPSIGTRIAGPKLTMMAGGVLFTATGAVLNVRAALSDVSSRLSEIVAIADVSAWRIGAAYAAPLSASVGNRSCSALKSSRSTSRASRSTSVRAEPLTTP